MGWARAGKDTVSTAPRMGPGTGWVLGKSFELNQTFKGKYVTNTEGRLPLALFCLFCVISLRHFSTKRRFHKELKTKNECARARSIPSPCGCASRTAPPPGALYPWGPPCAASPPSYLTTLEGKGHQGLHLTDGKMEAQRQRSGDGGRPQDF